MTQIGKVETGGRRDAVKPIAYQDVTISLPVGGKDMAKLLNEARRRGVTPNTLAAQLVSVVVEDDLYAAVLDR